MQERDPHIRELSLSVQVEEATRRLDGGITNKDVDPTFRQRLLSALSLATLSRLPVQWHLNCEETQNLTLR